MKHHRIRIRGLIILALALALLAGTLVFLRIQDDASYRETRGSMTDGFGELKTVNWGGAVWREKPAVTTILIGGIDQETRTDSGGRVRYQNGGQADLLMLVAIDRTDKKIHQLQIDRDTMTAVRVVGLFGDDGGTSEMQIALSHRFGATPRDNARNTVWAVQNLLDGLAIDNYYMIDYSGIAVLNDALGGIEVTIPEDMTRVNPAWTEGTTVTLQGQEAEAFVRARKSVGSGTNAERMTRQNVFMQNAVARLKQKVGDSLSFADELVSMLQDLAVSNLSARQLASLLTDSYRFEVLPVDHPSGSYEIGKNGYMEFRMQEDSAVEWVLQHLYTKQS